MGFFDKIKKAGSDFMKESDLKVKAMSDGDFTEEELTFFKEKNNGQSPEEYKIKQLELKKEREAKKAADAEKRKLAEEKKKLAEINDPRRYFKATRSSSNIQVDENHGLWRIKNALGGGSVYLYEELLSYDLSTNGNVQVKGGLSIGRAVVGGAIVGPIGAILGGVTGKKKQVKKINRIEININVKGSVRSTRTISIFKGKDINEDSSTARSYLKTAQKDLSLLDIISQSEPPVRFAEAEVLENVSTVEATQNLSSNSNNTADEIRKYKELLDEGILTQEEFDAKKKDLLGI